MKIDLKNILCTTDFSDPSNVAMPYAVSLAKEFSAKLYVCHVIHIPSAVIYSEGTSDPVSQQKRIMDQALDQLHQLLDQQPIKWEPFITLGHPADEIARMAGKKGIDLVVSATHGRSGLKRLILGSVTERLMRTLPCPIFVVRSPEQAPPLLLDRKITIKRVLVGCDFSPDSDLAFQYALNLAQEFQSELHLAHVIEPPVYRDLLKPAIEDLAGSSHQGLKKRLHEKLVSMVPEEACHWCTPVTALLAGSPHEELTKYTVVHDINLIVLGVRGHGLMETLFIGSTTDRVVRQAPCPVLSVRPKAGGS